MLGSHQIDSDNMIGLHLYIPPHPLPPTPLDFGSVKMLATV